MTKILVVNQGDSVPFTFDRRGASIVGWICTIEVKMFPADDPTITRVIAPVDNAWEGFLTSAEVSTLSEGLYRLAAILSNATTDERETVTSDTRFNVTANWETV